MRLTPTHLSFYRAKKAPPPSWATRLGFRLYPPSIDECVNEHAQVPRHEAETIALVERIRMIRRTQGNIGVRQHLGHMALPEHLQAPGASTEPRARETARKWLARILRDRGERALQEAA